MRRLYDCISLWALLPLVLLGFTSCQTQSLLVPPPHQVHLFKKQGEVQLSGGVSSAGVSGSIAVSPLPKFEIFGSFHKNDLEDGQEYHRQQLIEGGVGWYDDYADPIITELLFGIGKGTASFYDTEMIFRDRQFASSPVNASFTRFFTQFNFGMTSKAIDFGLSLRATHTRFPDYTFEVFQIDADFNRYQFTAEPVLFANVGYKNVRLEGQLGYPILFGDQTSSQLQGVTVSGGIKIFLGRSFDWLDY